MKTLLHRSTIAALLMCGACVSRGAAPTPRGTPAEPPAAPAEPQAAAQQHGRHHEHPAAQDHLPATAGAGYTAADVRFMQHMIGHHAQALVMAAMAPTHGASEHFQRLAQKIDISQRDEIAFMKQWLEERHQVVPPADYMAHMAMPGMLTAQELARLDAARGREFERLFLTFMIRHHVGALQMVEELFATPGAGQDPDIFRFVTDVDADQRDEIYVMSTMLDTLDNTPENSPR
jgi:uncharacterized protein (DUF305 family)